MTYKIMLTDSIYPDTSIEMAELEAIGARIVRPKGIDAASLLETGHDCDGILCDYASIDKTVIAGLGKCKVIAEAGIGVNNIDLEAAAAKGIKVANVPHYCLREVADHAMALFLACARKLLPYDRDIRAGKWDKLEHAPIYRLAGQNFCLFGFGAIARKVAARARAFEMQVHAFDPFLPDEAFAAEGVSRVSSLEKLARIADVFSIHAPLTDDTRGIVGRDVFSTMKAGCIVLNTSRGGLVAEQDLVDALAAGKIAAAGLDVLQSEPPKPDSPLLRMNNVVLTPHCGFFSNESDEELRRTMAREVVRTLTGGEPLSWVNRKYFS